ncbi:hypothetical protein Aperf_G00000103791 [Anoplocephala perfoliata]
MSNNPVLGEIVESSGLRVHLNCLYTASGLTQRIEPNGRKNMGDGEFFFGFEVKEIKSEIRRGNRLRCHYCGKHGACVGCAVTKCRLSFHLPCIFEAKGIACFKGHFDAFCFSHRPKQNLSQRLMFYDAEPPVCCVCLFSIASESSNPESPHSISSDIVSRCNQRFADLSISESSSNPIFPHFGRRLSQRRFFPRDLSDPVASIPPEIRHLKWLRYSVEKYFLASSRRLPSGSAFDAWSHAIIHGGCCRPSWMHRECIAGYARSAGLHHLKCPLCLDKRVFIPTIIRFGVWVPDRDASWELQSTPNPDSDSSLEVEVATSRISPQVLRVEASIQNTEAIPLGHPTASVSHYRLRRHTVLPPQSDLRPLRSHNRDRLSLRQRSPVNIHGSKKPLLAVEEGDDENKENVDPLLIIPR